MTLEEFKSITWEEMEDGTIVPESPDHLPIIKQWLEAKHDRDKLKVFVESLGEEWIDENHPSYQRPGNWTDEY